MLHTNNHDGNAGEHACRDEWGERDERDEWAGLTSLFGLVRAFPLRILAITTLTALAGFLLASTSDRKFESSVYVGLGDWQSHNPVLEGLGIPVGTEDTKDAFSILRSQEVLGLVVSGPQHGPESFRMDLTTWIEETPSDPWRKLHFAAHDQGDKRHSLRGSYNAPPGNGLALYFEDQSHVWATPADSARNPWLRGLGAGLGKQARLLDLSSNSEHTFDGYRLSLTVEGDLTGRSFTLQQLQESQAIDRLRASITLRVPNSRKQVLQAILHSTQALHSQELATALSNAFLHHERTKFRSQAQDVVDYLARELDQRQSELGELDLQLANLRTQNPDLSNPEARIEKLNRLLTQAQENLERVTLQQAGLARALDHESLSHMSLITLRRIAMNPQIDRWLDRIDELQNLAQGSQPPRFDATFQNQTERLHALEIEQRTALRYAELFDQRLAEFLGGKPASLAALLDDNGQDLAESQPMIDLAVRPFRAAEAKLIATQERYKDKHPAVVAAKQEVALKRQRLRAALRAHSSSLRENHARVVSAMRPLQERLVDAPVQIRQQWITGGAALWSKVRGALQAQHTGAIAQMATHAAQVKSLTQRIKRLPFDRSALESPMVQRKALGDKIHQLLAKQEDAEVALAGLRPGASVLEPASSPLQKQPHLDRLGALVGMLIGLLVSLGWAQFSTQRARLREARNQTFGAGLPHVKLPVLSRMIRSCMDDNFAVAHPMRPDQEGPAFAALRRLRVQLNLLAERQSNTSLLGVTSLVAELNEFGTEEEPSPRHLTHDSWKGSFFSSPSLVTSTIGGLAVSHTLSGKRVAIVDADVLGNSMTAHLELTPNPGLAECLLGEGKWESHMVTIEPSQVDVLPLGRPIGAGDELLAHPGLEPLLRELQEHYDVVLVELPPLNEAPHLARLAPLLGSVLMVENARNPLDPAESARILGPLRRSGSRLVGSFVAIRGLAQISRKAA